MLEFTDLPTGFYDTPTIPQKCDFLPRSQHMPTSSAWKDAGQFLNPGLLLAACCWLAGLLACCLLQRFSQLENSILGPAQPAVFYQVALATRACAFGRRQRPLRNCWRRGRVDRGTPAMQAMEQVTQVTGFKELEGSHIHGIHGLSYPWLDDGWMTWIWGYILGYPNSRLFLQVGPLFVFPSFVGTSLLDSHRSSSFFGLIL